MDKFKKICKQIFFSFTWLAVLLLVIDIITKIVVMNNLAEGESITLIPGFLWITYVRNTNAAFGLGFTGDELINRIIYIVIAVIGSAAIIFFYVYRYKKIGKYVKACLMMMLVGALGNLIDRLFYAKSGYAVVDWINFFDISWWHWVFNIADASIVIGVIMLVVYLIVDEIKEYKIKKAKQPKVEGKVLSAEEKSRLEILEAEKNSEEKQSTKETSIEEEKSSEEVAEKSTPEDIKNSESEQELQEEKEETEQVEN